MEAVVGAKYCDGSERELTVRKTAVFYPGDGYATYDHRTGGLVFRVDNYVRRRGPTLSDQLVLMDPTGDPILTVRRKELRLSIAQSDRDRNMMAQFASKATHRQWGISLCKGARWTLLMETFSTWWTKPHGIICDAYPSGDGLLWRLFS